MGNPYGFRTISDAEYHADPAPEPSLSSSIAKVLLNQSPMHAWFQHPRLNPQWTPDEPSGAMNFGTAVHLLVLAQDGAGEITVVEANDWKTNAAKGARLEAWKAGRPALLEKDFDRARAVAAALRAAIARSELAAFLKPALGDYELTAIWRDERPELPEPVTCRAKFDWIAKDRGIALDLKTTARTASPGAAIATILQQGYDVQAAFYRRGVQVLTGVVPVYVLVFVETEPPYGVSFIGFKPEWLAFGEHKAVRAAQAWANCRKTNLWPGYPERICWVDAPPWAESAFMAKELPDE
jgi:hypothetical protein